MHPSPAGLVIVTKLGGRRPPDKSWQRANSPAELTAGVHDNLRNLGLDTLDIVNYRVMGSGHSPEEGSVSEQVTVLAGGLDGLPGLAQPPGQLAAGGEGMGVVGSQLGLGDGQATI